MEKDGVFPVKPSEPKPELPPAGRWLQALCAFDVEDRPSAPPWRSRASTTSSDPTRGTAARPSARGVAPASASDRISTTRSSSAETTRRPLPDRGEARRRAASPSRTQVFDSFSDTDPRPQDHRQGPPFDLPAAEAGVRRSRTAEAAPERGPGGLGRQACRRDAVHGVRVRAGRRTWASCWTRARFRSRTSKRIADDTLAGLEHLHANGVSTETSSRRTCCGPTRASGSSTSTSPCTRTTRSAPGRNSPATSHRTSSSARRSRPRG